MKPGNSVYSRPLGFLRRFRPRSLIAGASLVFLLAAGFIVGERLSAPWRYYQAPPQLPHNLGLAWDEMKNNPYAFIMHAGGDIDGHVYTNSLEAVLASIAQGAKFIELDMALTADGHIVALHDWELFKAMTGHNYGNAPLTLEQFKSCRIYGKYTPLDAAGIRDIFLANKDLLLFVDKIDNYELIPANFPFMDRVYVEAAKPQRYKAAISADIKHVLMPVYYPDDFDYVSKYEPPLVALNAGLLAEHGPRVQALLNQGVYIFAYTINDEPSLKNYLGRTINGVYIDHWPLGREYSY